MMTMMLFPWKGEESERTSESEERVVGLTVLMLRKRSKNDGIKTNDSEGGFGTVIVQDEMNEVRKESLDP